MTAEAAGHTPAIDIAGVRWTYTDRGTGPLVVFLHGTLASAEMFDDVVSSLHDRYRCVAIDLPGHAHSGYNPQGWSVDDVVTGVAALIAALREPKAILVGLSQGGAVALRVALRYPALVEALITMGAGPDGPGPEALAALTELGRILESGSDEQRRAAALQLQPAFHAAGWAQARPQQAQRELSVMLGHDRHAMPLVTRVPATYASIEDRLSDISCPTLVMWGAEDPRASWGPRMVATLPNARLVIVQHAGHHVTADAPEVCSREIGDFLAGLHRQGGKRI